MKWIIAVLCTALTAIGQPGAGGSPEFEAASVRRLSDRERGPLMNLPASVAMKMSFAGGPGSKDPGRIDYAGVSMRLLLAKAHDLEPEQIIGPDWLDTERYTIAATLPPGTDVERLRLMLQRLLTERFAIGFHRDVKELPVYRLKIAKNGPLLKPAETMAVYKDDDERKAAQRASALDILAAQRDRMTRGDFSRGFHIARGTTAAFAEMLSNNLDRPVRDMTEIEGLYSFSLTWTPDTAPSVAESAPSVFVAIEEQLGLRLEAGRESTELVVIDRMEKSPARN